MSELIDEIARELAEGPLRCWGSGDCYNFGRRESRDAREHDEDCPARRIPAVAAWVAKREEGLREYAVKLDDWNDALQAEHDALREQLAGARARALLVFVALGGDQGESESLDAAVSRIVAERDALRAEVEKLREVVLVARETRDAMDITLSSDDLDGEWEFENTVPIWHDRLADRLRSLDAYRASQADTLIKRTIVDSKEIIDGLAQADKGGEGET